MTPSDPTAQRSGLRLLCRTLIVMVALAAAARLPRASAAAPATTGPATAPARVADDGQPVTIAHARQYDITSKLNGQAYRLFVYVPPKLDLAQPQPVVYVLDGSYYFGAACDSLGVNKLMGIVVAVGYPTDDRDEVARRRTFDLSLPVASGSKKYGGGDAFLRVVNEEVKPFVAARYPVDPARQAIFGHSLGGLMVLRQLFRDPQAYGTYLATSPSIWWGKRAVLADEDAFAKRAKAGELHLRVLITSASEEQGKGSRMIDDATELAARLAALDPADLVVTRQMISGENHPSGSIASLSRALQFALKVPE
jgi:predicted alpha/beta superfamily hydrolase